MFFVRLHLQNEIKNHMFFSPINWDDLNAKKLTPPFNPNVVGSIIVLWLLVRIRVVIVMCTPCSQGRIFPKALCSLSCTWCIKGISQGSKCSLAGS